MMKSDPRQIPTGSQTVGPFFDIGLQYLIERTPEIPPNEEGWVEVQGKVVDGNGAPVPDAMLEFWTPQPIAQATDQASQKTSHQDGFPVGFRRAATDPAGNFSLKLAMPAPVALPDGSLQAPHFLVLVFARGLLRHLLSRMYFEDAPGNADDLVLRQLPPDRRATLIARRAGNQAAYRWNIVLQGADETAFFAW